MGDRPRRYLLAVGVEKYDDETWMELTGAPIEVERIVSLLTNQPYGFERILCAVSRNPTPELLEQLADWGIAQERKTDDQLIVYWTGHGEVRTEELHLILKTSKKKTLTGTILAKDLIERALPERGCGGVLLVLDVCYSGQALADIGQRLGALTRTRPTKGMPEIAILSASRPREEAQQCVFVNAFAHALQRGEQEAVSNQPGLYLEQILRDARKEMPPSQSPVLFGHFSEAQFFDNPKYAPGKPLERNDAAHTRVGWLRWVELQTAAGAAPIQPKLWPITIDAAIGLDRGRQVAFCRGLDALVVLAELSALEYEIAAHCKQHNILARTWRLLETPCTPSPSANIVWQADKTMGRDVIEGLIASHFEDWGGTHGVSAVVVLPTEDETEFVRISAILAKALIERLRSVCVACFLPWDPDVAWRQLSDLQKAKFNEIRAADHMVAAGDIFGQIENRASRRATTLRQWLRGDMSNSAFVGEAEEEDVRLAILAGRFGDPRSLPLKTHQDRACALVSAATDKHLLRVALPSLPSSPALLRSLNDAPVSLRAILGFVSQLEASAKPPPWVFEPIRDRRHGRPFLV